jgi:hypothetical protein
MKEKIQRKFRWLRTKFGPGGGLKPKVVETKLQVFGRKANLVARPPARPASAKERAVTFKIIHSFVIFLSQCL